MPRPKLSPLAFAVLGVLDEEPMHAYRLRQRLQIFGKDRVVNLGQRASTYQAIERLASLGLIAAMGVDRDAGRPERTTYASTDEGRRVVDEWLEETLGTPNDEFPIFGLALSFATRLDPARFRALLVRRHEHIGAEIEETDGVIAGAGDVAPIFLVEEHYRLAVRRAEHAWLAGLIRDVDAGVVTWSVEGVRAEADRYHREHEGDSDDA